MELCVFTRKIKRETIMKNYLYNKILIVMLCCYVGAIFSSCSNDITVATIDEDNYITSKTPQAYVLNQEGKRLTSLVEFREEGNSSIYVHLDKAAKVDVSAEIAYNAELLTEYNEQNESNYELFPEELVSIENDGKVTITKGEKQSSAGVVTFTSSASLETDKTYVIPVSAKVNSADAEISERSSKHLIFVRDFSKIPSADKGTGVKIVSCMEVNDTNPLNNLSFYMKNSGKPLVDIVIFFSANINYDAERGRVYVYQNPEVTTLLANREKYIKPLQDAGIKVVLGILGNHDRAAITNLADDTARDFAVELKAVLDAYKLDGVFWDDEYSSPITPPPAGFVRPGQGTSRLIYETKRLMPDKLNIVYVYGGTRNLRSVVDEEGNVIQPGEYIDGALHDYGGSSNLSGNYPGLAKTGMGLYSQEFNRGYWTSEYNLKSMRERGYGLHMIFAMDPFRYNAELQISQMEMMARVLFDDELEVREFYEADHK